MNRSIQNQLSALFLVGCLSLFSPFDTNGQGPPPPPGGSGGGGSGTGGPDGSRNGAPIDGGLGILLALGGAYGAYKVYRIRKEKREGNGEPEGE